MYFAHAGHWLTSIAYFVPVLAFLVWLGVTHLKDRRRTQTAGRTLRVDQEETEDRP